MSLKSEELLDHLSAALAQRDQLLEYVAKLEHAGTVLSNIAYNFKQKAKMSEVERADLHDCQIKFDKVVRTKPPLLLRK